MGGAQVITNCLHRNLEHTHFTEAGRVHTTRVEAFLAAAAATPRGPAGGPFDYISLCPPYDKACRGGADSAHVPHA